MWLTYLQIKKLVKGRNNVFRREQSLNKAPFTFLDVKKVKGFEQWGSPTI